VSKEAIVPFNGFLVRWEFWGSELEVRFSSGNFEDEAKNGVLYVLVDTPIDREALEDRLKDVGPYETEVTVKDPSSTEVTVQLEYGDPIVLQGKRVSLRRVDFEAEDYARLALLHHQSSDLANDLSTSLASRIAGAKHLLQDQAQRIAEKAKGHKGDSTARTLYDQQLSFISRVISKLDT
jgi:hypothetical protein